MSARQERRELKRIHGWEAVERELKGWKNGVRHENITEGKAKTWRWMREAWVCCKGEEHNSDGCPKRTADRESGPAGVLGKGSMQRILLHVWGLALKGGATGQSSR